MIDCRYCEEQHGDLLLCAPAKRVLDALYAQGQRFDMPTVEFSQPIAGAGMFGDDTVLVAQLVVKAATVPVAGIPRPMLIFTGIDAGGSPLPQWLYPAAPDEIRKAVKLVSDTGEMAIRAARKQAKP